MAIIKIEEIKKSLREKVEELEIERKKKYSEYFLCKLNLKVGDIVPCNFSVNSGNRNQSFMSLKESDGIIKIDGKGIAFVESLETLSRSYNKNNGRSGRSYRDWWIYRKEKQTAFLGNIIIEKLSI